MDQVEGAEALRAGNPVVIYTYGVDGEAPERYVGVLTGLDDIFLSAKITHEWRTVQPEVMEESREALRKILRKRKLWSLHLQVAARYRTVTLGQSRDELVEKLANAMEIEAIREIGPSTGFVELPLARHASLAIPDVRRLEALYDIRDASVLQSLDFEPELPETTED